MATIHSTVLPQGTYPPQTRVLGPASVPLGLTSMTLSFDKTAWTDPVVTLDLSIDLSLDGGASWFAERVAADEALAAQGNSSFPNTTAALPFPIALTAEGGGTDKFGNPLTAVTRAAPLPQPDNANRKVRATVIIAGGNLTTSATLNVS